ncbi:PspC domain-containing protein [Rhodocytophaga aerolata]|uniref:PspC domain-containing protein n=1 Tax=Rhodocytophaga aerolata TaxID=455078 RepID=A0ABT8R413_9BACT|nr:PspC domain-containing protein [Rhodocytophaga aerolata]MDO1446823.1 PspC domain-containing protein [Rhodocytophaga aerolata]
MKKTISINISGIIFHIEEDGYEKLRNYLSTIGRYFSTYEDNKEIIADIESRIAEIFLTKLNPGKQVITLEDVDMLIVKMGNISDFAAIEEEENHARASANTAYATSGSYTNSGENTAGPGAETTSTAGPKRLYRDLTRKVAGGVASGIANYFNIDPLWIRLLFVGTFFDLFFLPGSLSGVSLITYIVLWVVTPGSATLPEDKAVKKLYRNPDKKVISGVAGGIAAYFGIDETIIRLMFVLSVVFFGTGLLLYFILWAIVPEAKTITEKMQMQGEPVTLSNIEHNIKKNFEANENGEESTLLKILLFPFRLVAIVFGAIIKAVGPLTMFILAMIRVSAGVLLIVISVAFIISLVTVLGVGLGLINTYEFVNLGELPLELLRNSFPVVGLISLFVLAFIPAFTIGQLGTSLIAKKSTISAPFGWTLFGLWIVALITTGVTVPAYAGQFSTRGYYETTSDFTIGNKILYLDLREAGNETYDNTSLVLEPYEGNVPRLVQKFEARGRNRQDAINNAKTIQYTVTQKDSVLLFDENFTFSQDAKFRAQSLKLILYIPYNQLFTIDEKLQNILDMYGYNYDNSKTKLLKYVKGEGLICTNCLDNENLVAGEIKTGRDGNIREFSLRDFDRLNIGSAFRVHVTQGDNYLVRISGDKEDIEDIRARVRDGELEVFYNNKFDIFNWNVNRDRIRVDITMPTLAGVHFHGASESYIQGFGDEQHTGNTVDVQVSGAAKSVIDIAAHKISADLNGAAELELKGRTEVLEAEVSSAARLRAFDLVAGEVDVDVSSSGLAEVHANEKLIAEASSAGKVRYRGEAKVTSEVSSAGSVSKE